MSNQLNGNRWLIALALWAPLIFTLIVLFLANRSQHLRDLDAKWILHTFQVKDQVEHLNSLVRDVGAGERGYLLTRDASFLPLYQNAIKEIPAESKKLAELVKDNPTQVEAAANLQLLIAKKLAMTAQALSLIGTEKSPETIEMYRDTQAKPLNDEIRFQVEAMTTEEDQLLTQRENDFALQVQSQKNEMIGLVAVEIALIVGLTLLLLRSRKLHLTAGVRIDEAQAMTDQAQASTMKAMARTKRAEVRAAEADTRTEEAEIRGEEGIRASELRYRRLFETAQDGIIVLDAATGQVVDVNPYMKHLLGYSQEEMLGRKLWEIGAFKGAAASKIAYAKLVQSGRIQSENLFLETKDGRPIQVEFISNAYRMDENLLVQCNIRDITERESAAEQIAEQAALLDEAQDAIIVRDLEGKVIFWNKGAERMYGWTRQEVLGLNVSPLLFRNQKKFAEISALTINHGKWSGDLQHLTKDKKEITVEARWTLIRDEDGNPKSVLAINTDVTEKKKIEGQFLRAQRMDSIGTLAGGVAHDLNNILQPILMSIELLQQKATDPESLNFLRTIEVSAKRGADIVKQVLSFARGVEGERIEIQPKHLLKDLESIIKNTFPKNIRLRFSIPDDTWMILGDPTQVHQILLNLCVNARDAMPNGGNLSLGLENCELDEQYAVMNLQAKPGRYVNINVTDSGTGIPPAILDKIFEPFFTTKEINEGTGLGLSTVMGIVKSHGGVINVYSEIGNGTTFKVYLPAMELSDEAQRKLSQRIIVPRGNGEMILVIDDEASILTITGQTLKAFGYRVLTATDGAEAVGVFAENKDEIVVVLTDMSMPIMDGAALIRALTKINPEIKIVAASGLNANSDTAKVAGVTVKHFLTKPYTAGTLLKVIRSVLDQP